MSKGLPLKLDASALSRQDSGSIVAADLLAKKEVKVKFILPNGTTLLKEAKAGFTVEQLKSLVEQETNIPYAKLSLYHNDKLMPDPLSISDITDISKDVEVTVKEN